MAKVKVIPINRISWRTYPIDTDYILLTQSELKDLQDKKKMFSADLTTLVDYNLKGLIDNDSENE